MSLDDDFVLKKLNTSGVQTCNIKIEDSTQVVNMEQIVTIELSRNSALHLNDIALPLNDIQQKLKIMWMACLKIHAYVKHRQNRETQHSNLVPRT